MFCFASSQTNSRGTHRRAALLADDVTRRRSQRTVDFIYRDFPTNSFAFCGITRGRRFWRRRSGARTRAGRGKRPAGSAGDVTPPPARSSGSRAGGDSVRVESVNESRLGAYFTLCEAQKLPLNVDRPERFPHRWPSAASVSAEVVKKKLIIQSRSSAGEWEREDAEGGGGGADLVMRLRKGV